MKTYEQFKDYVKGFGINMDETPLVMGYYLANNNHVKFDVLDSSKKLESIDIDKDLSALRSIINLVDKCPAPRIYYTDTMSIMEFRHDEKYAICVFAMDDGKECITYSLDLVESFSYNIDQLQLLKMLHIKDFNIVDEKQDVEAIYNIKELRSVNDSINFEGKKYEIEAIKYGNSGYILMYTRRSLLYDTERYIFVYGNNNEITEEDWI